MELRTERGGSRKSCVDIATSVDVLCPQLPNPMVTPHAPITALLSSRSERTCGMRSGTDESADALQKDHDGVLPMPLHAASYFAGVATVVATVTLGFGAGVLMTDAFVGASQTLPTLMERRAAPASDSPLPAVAAAPDPATAPVQPSVADSSAPAPPAVAAVQAIPAQVPIRAAPPDTAPVQASGPAQADVQAEAQRNDDAMAKVRDIETKKAAAADRRKEQRRKWAERRKRELQRTEELQAVAEKVRAAERERQPVARSFFAESPRINLFDND